MRSTSKGCVGCGAFSTVGIWPQRLWDHGPDDNFSSTVRDVHEVRDLLAVPAGSFERIGPKRGRELDQNWSGFIFRLAAGFLVRCLRR